VNSHLLEVTGGRIGGRDRGGLYGERVQEDEDTDTTGPDRGSVLEHVVEAPQPVCKAHRLLYHSTLGLRVTKMKKSLATCRTHFTRTSIYDKYSGSMTITTRLDHISHCKTASGTNWSNTWTYRVCIINTRRD